MTEIDLIQWAGQDVARCGLVAILLAVDPGAVLVAYPNRAFDRFQVHDEDGESIGHHENAEAAIVDAITNEIKRVRVREREQFNVLRQLDAALVGIARLSGVIR